MSQPNRVALLLSGGPDSASLAQRLIAKGFEVSSLTLANEHHTSNIAEVNCARDIAANLGILHKVVDLSGLSGLFDTNPNFQLSMGGVSSCLPKQMKVAPGSVEIMLSAAASFSIAQGCQQLYWAVHKGDLDQISADAITEYCAHFSRAVAIRNETEFSIQLPFLDMTKAEVLTEGMRNGLSLNKTYSCFSPNLDGSECGSCYKCKEKAKALQEVDDLMLSGVSLATRYVR